MLKTAKDSECLDALQDCFPELKDIVEAYAFAACPLCDVPIFGPAFVFEEGGFLSGGMIASVKLFFDDFGVGTIPLPPSFPPYGKFGCCARCFIREQILYYTPNRRPLQRGGFRFSFFGSMRNSFAGPKACFDIDIELFTLQYEYRTLNDALRVMEYSVE